MGTIGVNMQIDSLPSQRVTSGLHMSSLGEIMYGARKRRNMTQEQVAKLAGISRKHYAAIEADEAPNVSFSIVRKAARALGLREVRVDGFVLHVAGPSGGDLGAVRRQLEEIARGTNVALQIIEDMSRASDFAEVQLGTIMHEVASSTAVTPGAEARQAVRRRPARASATHGAPSRALALGSDERATNSVVGVRRSKTRQKK